MHTKMLTLKKDNLFYRLLCFAVLGTLVFSMAACNSRETGEQQENGMTNTLDVIEWYIVEYPDEEPMYDSEDNWEEDENSDNEDARDDDHVDVNGTESTNPPCQEDALRPETLEPGSITRAQFSALVVAMYEDIKERSIKGYIAFRDTSDINTMQSAYLGVLHDVGNGNFAPYAGLTREQAAVALVRVAEIFEIPLQQQTPVFEDRTQISDWAVVYVGKMQATGIMPGTDNGFFEPRSAYTKEESILTLSRLYERMDIPFRLNTMQRPVVLMYHSISDRQWQVTAANFEAQIRYLAKNGFTFLFADEIHNSDQYDNPIIITLDDGFADNYEVAFEILKRYHAKATIFMTTAYIGQDGWLTAAQIQEMENSGLIRVEPHTHNHPDLSRITLDEVRWQIETSNAILREITGRDHRVFAYPFGKFSDEVHSIMSEYYDIVFAVGNGDRRNMMSLYRTSVFNDMNAFKKNVRNTACILQRWRRILG